jgi:uncharacterized protein YecE (DUF72 family)
MEPGKCVAVGCQGWNYEDWVTGPAGIDRVFYPRGTRADEMLTTYARAFETVEVDSTVYGVPPAQTIEGWFQRTPRDFTFSLKTPREVTHERALRSAGYRVFEEFCQRARLLKAKLAVILIQLPPSFEPTAQNRASLREFLVHLPTDLRFSIEFRHRDWMTIETMDVLRKHSVPLALVEAKWISRDLMVEHASSAPQEFVYVRWMGERDLTRFDQVQRAQDANLSEWREILADVCARSPRVFAYFSNFYEGYAVASANKLKRLLGQPTVDINDLEQQPSLFG